MILASHYEIEKKRQRDNMYMNPGLSGDNNAISHITDPQSVRVGILLSSHVTS